MLQGNDFGLLIDDEDFIVDSRIHSRNRLVKVEDDGDDLSDDIKWRLFLARQLALMKYREKWAA